MSQKPSWLDDEETSTAVGAVAVKVAASPAVQKSVIDEITPSWAKSQYVPPSAPGSAPGGKDTEAQRATSDAAGTEPVEFQTDPETLKNMNSWRWVLGCCYLTAALNLAVAAGLRLVGQTDVSVIFFALYVIFFSGIMCCYELAFGDIARSMAINFGFLYTSIGRLVFVVFVGIMSFDLNGVYNIIAMCILYIAYLINIYVRCRYPQFEEFMRKRHYFKHQPNAA